MFLGATGDEICPVKAVRMYRPAEGRPPGHSLKWGSSYEREACWKHTLSANPGRGSADRLLGT